METHEDNFKKHIFHFGTNCQDKSNQHPPILSYQEKLLKIFKMIINGEFKKLSVKTESQKRFPDSQCPECHYILKQAWNFCVHCGKRNLHFSSKAFNYLFNRIETEFYKFECEMLKHNNAYIYWEIKGYAIYCFHCGIHLFGNGYRAK